MESIIIFVKFGKLFHSKLSIWWVQIVINPLNNGKEKSQNFSLSHLFWH